MNLRRTLVAAAVTVVLPGATLAAGNVSITNQRGDNQSADILQTDPNAARALATIDH